MLDIEKILGECDIKNKPAQDVIRTLAGLEEFYNCDELAQIYNYVLLNNTNIEILTGVIRLSNNLRHASTLSVLTDMLLMKNGNLGEIDDIINLRVECIRAIANYKDTSTLGILLYCLNNKDENYKIRLACADAMGRIGDRFAVAPLIKVIEDEDEKSVYVKESATFALGLLGDTSAIEPLVAIMEAKQDLWDKFTFLKEKIVEALGKLNINNAKVLKVLKTSLLDVSPIVRINSIEALMKSEYDEAPALIKNALHDEDEEVQRNALIALYNLEGRDVLDEIISLPGYSEFLKKEAQNLIDEYEDE